jgi:predicted ArsR family transcriptional regulator
MSKWTLFSNHGHVLVCLARDPEARLRDVAVDVGITERAVQKIVRDLKDGNMVSVTKIGRRNYYRIHNKKSLRHDLEAHSTLSDLANIIDKDPGKGKGKAEAQSTSVQMVRSIESKPTRIEPEKPEPEKPKSGKHVISDSIERQQGTLF